MAYWLIKTEPSDYSLGDLLAEGRTTWTGVKNALARIHLRAMKTGDSILLYHTGSQKAVVGLAKVIKAAAKKGAEPQVEIGQARQLARAVGLAVIKRDKQFSDWGLVKMGRLSVVPTTREQFDAVLALAEQESR